MTRDNGTALADVCESVRYGYTASASHEEVGPRFLRITDIVPDLIDWDSVPFCEIDDADRDRFSLQPGDIVVARTGATVGYAKLIRDQVDTVFASYLVRFRVDPTIADPGFVGRLVESFVYKDFVKSRVGGAAQPNANAQILGSFRFRPPPRREQERIASILSSYDDLIENNRRRMALLEEAARQLYREWFVRLRFPGHEHTRITNGVPEGWHEVRFEEVLSDLESGGRPRGGAKDDEGIPSIGAENVLGIGRYDYAKEKYVPEEYFEQMTRGIVRNRDVVLYKDGANIGRASYFGEGFPHEKCAVNEHVFILRSRPDVGQSFLYFWMTREENRQAIANLNANTAQPGISQEKLKSLRFLLPAERFTRAFNDAVEAQVRQIFTLALMNRKLAAARDLLLPRLMSGEIAA